VPRLAREDEGSSLNRQSIIGPSDRGRCWMHDPFYYRDEAERARRLARFVTSRETAAALSQAAREYDDIAEDLENGAIEVPHSETR